MQSTVSIISRLKLDYPQFSFKSASQFSWSPSENTIYYNKEDGQSILLLHELSHALIGHSSYRRDIELITIEREAWDKAKELAKRYDIDVDNNIIQSALDTYRDWLHSRSICPSCRAIGVQFDTHNYRCIVCDHKWRVNEARQCALRRYDITKIKNAD